MIDYEKLVDIKNLTLNLTDDCNLKCRYCFVIQNPNYMSLQVAKDAVDLLIKYNKQLQYDNDVPPACIKLFGGEPLLMWNQVIVPLVEYALVEKRYRVKFSITTNGTLLTRDKIDFIKRHDIDIMLSMDGDKDTQDSNRPFKNVDLSSFDVLEDKIEMIVKSFPKILMRGTIVPDKANKVFDNIMFAKNCGFRNVGSFINELDDWPDEYMDILRSEVTKYMYYFISEMSKDHLSDDFILWQPFDIALHEYKDIKKIISEKRPYQLIGVKTCGLGLNYIAVNYKGDIFSCHDMVSFGDKNNPYCIGNIYTGIDRDRHIALLSKYIGHQLKSEEPELCKDCIRRYICNNGFCHARSFVKNGDMTSKTRARCLFNSYLVESAGFACEVLMRTEENNAFKDLLKTDF